MKVYMFIKRIIDFCLSLSSLLVLGLPILLISILIKVESKGPVLLSKDMLGRGGKPFKMYEYRTKFVDGENRSEELGSKTTKVGKFLIKTRLDELPRLINIIKGQMSIIGPEPISLSESKEYGGYLDFEKKRFDVLPGTTGLAQLAFGEDTSWDEMISKDVEYAQRINFKMDTDIFIKTLFKSIALDNIYVESKKDEED